MLNNPFPDSETDRLEIWDMLVRRDIKAYVKNDWAAHSEDFLTELFAGIDAQGSDNPDSWITRYPTIESYGKAWQASAQSSQGRL